MTLVVAALAGTFAIAAPGAASAADYDYPAAIDPGSITVTTTNGGDDVTLHQNVRVDASWSVPDAATAGQTFGFTLPGQFARAAMAFSVPAVDDPSAVVADCVVSGDGAPVVTCTLTDYVEGRTGVTGDLWFLASADEESSEGSVAFTVNGEQVWVEIPGGGIGPADAPPVQPQKWSWQTDDGRIAWELALPGASFDGADAIIVDDVLQGPDDGHAEHHNVDGKLAVWSTDAAGGDRRAITDWSGAWNGAGTAFHLEIGGPIDTARTYFVEYFTVPGAPTEGATYSNTADVNGVVLDDEQVWHYTGGGSGDGTANGGFTLAKTVTGAAAATVPSDAEYTVRYSYGDPAVERTVALTAGTTSARIALPAGTVVTLEELTPPSVDGIEWGAAVFSGTGVRVLDDGSAQITIGAGTTVAVSLTNTAQKPPVVPPTTPPAPPVHMTPPAELPLTSHGTLATTGSDLPDGLLWAGGATLLLGLALIVHAAVRARQRVRGE